MDVPKEEYEAISRVIASEDNSLGIDAAKTHVIILHKLREIERRLEKIEQRLEE